MNKKIKNNSTLPRDIRTHPSSSILFTITPKRTSKRSKCKSKFVQTTSHASVCSEDKRYCSNVGAIGPGFRSESSTKDIASSSEQKPNLTTHKIKLFTGANPNEKGQKKLHVKSEPNVFTWLSASCIFGYLGQRYILQGMIGVDRCRSVNAN